MFSLEVYMMALGAVCLMGVLAWPVSVLKKDVAFVDSLWSLFFLLCALVSYLSLEEASLRATLVLGLVAVWALRLSLHITWRNWGKEEDHRYQAIRRNNEPFWLKSLYVVFLLQAALAWLVSLPLHGAILGDSRLGPMDFIGVVLFAIGLIFEAIGDYQLAQFKANPANAGKVLRTGLWRYTRHPNYFGDFAIWWGFYLMALGAGAWWSFPAPILMSFLLLRVSGVRLLEKDIGQRRPEYADYVRRTSPFIPWFPKA